MYSSFQKYIVEFIGTFFLVFTIGCAVIIAPNGIIAPIAIGVILMTMVYAFGHISGGHFNPAVSFAASIRGALPWKQLIPYSIAQIFGALVAGILICFLTDNTRTIIEFALLPLFIVEFLFTFALAYVVLNVATADEVKGNSYFGFAIGAVVMTGAFVVGSLALGAFNPAVAVSLLFWGIASPTLFATTIAANLLGGLTAGLVFNSLLPKK